MTGITKVLIVDDEPLMAMDLDMLLNESGFSTIGPAHSTDEALSFIEGERPDLAILDVNLSNGTSNRVAAKLEELDIPFLFLTGYSEDQVSDKYGARGFISKPYDEDKLLRAVAGIAG